MTNREIFGLQLFNTYAETQITKVLNMQLSILNKYGIKGIDINKIYKLELINAIPNIPVIKLEHNNLIDSVYLDNNNIIYIINNKR